MLNWGINFYQLSLQNDKASISKERLTAMMQNVCADFQQLRFPLKE